MGELRLIPTKTSRVVLTFQAPTRYSWHTITNGMFSLRVVQKISFGHYYKRKPQNNAKRLLIKSENV